MCHVICRKKKPVGGVSLFGGADIFGDLIKSPDISGNSVLEISMENKNEVCTMCVYVRGVCVWVCRCVCGGVEGGRRKVLYVYMYVEGG